MKSFGRRAEAAGKTDGGQAGYENLSPVQGQTRRLMSARHYIIDIKLILEKTIRSWSAPGPKHHDLDLPKMDLSCAKVTCLFNCIDHLTAAILHCRCLTGHNSALAA